MTVCHLVRLGYISQSREQLNPHSMVWAEVAGESETIPIGNGVSMPARNYVAQFGFKGQDQQKRVHQLSGMWVTIRILLLLARR